MHILAVCDAFSLFWTISPLQPCLLWPWACNFRGKSSLLWAQSRFSSTVFATGDTSNLGHFITIPTLSIYYSTERQQSCYMTHKRFFSMLHLSCYPEAPGGLDWFSTALKRRGRVVCKQTVVQLSLRRGMYVNTPPRSDSEPYCSLSIATHLNNKDFFFSFSASVHMNKKQFACMVADYCAGFTEHLCAL